MPEESDVWSRRREPDRREPGGPLPGRRPGGGACSSWACADDELAGRWDAAGAGGERAAFRAEMARREADDLLGMRGRKSPPRSCRRANEALDRCGAGLQVEQVCFGDIHPPLEVVPAFRDVSIAMEEKEARINEAQAYQYQTEAAARGQAAERMAPRKDLPPIGRSGPRPPRRGSWTWPRPTRPRPRSPACGSTCRRWKRPWRATGK